MKEKPQFKTLGKSGGALKSSGSFSKKSKKGNGGGKLGDTASRNAPGAEHHKTNRTGK